MVRGGGGIKGFDIKLIQVVTVYVLGEQILNNC